MSSRAWVEGLESRHLYVATVPAGFTMTNIATGLAAPTGVAALPDGRVLIARKGGAVQLIGSAGLSATPALTLKVDSSTERGLLGLAVDPKFTTNHYLYAYYFAPNKGYGQVSRFTMNGDTVDPASQLTILTLTKQLNGGQHCGGGMTFGPDGKLYIAVGDNEAVGDDPATAASADLSSTSGKLLRINSNGSIPSDNPYYGTASGALRSIYAIGLRNPFTISTDPISGAMYVGDVGNKAFEEIDVVRRGANYGWPATEGPTTDPAYDGPIYAYAPPAPGAGSCIIGGPFYSGVTQQFPAGSAGKYFFGDFALGFIQTFDPATRTAIPFATGMGNIVALTATPDGTLLCTAFNGTVTAIRYTGQPTTPSTPPAPPPAGTAGITGYVVNDKNANGKWDSGEVGIVGRSVWIDLDNDGLLDDGETAVATGANGKFTFANLAAGTYAVRQIVPTGSHQTSPVANAALTITLTAGQMSSGKSFEVATG